MINVLVNVFNGNEIRHVMINGEPWWVAKDVCDVLEIKDVSSSLRKLDDDEKGTHSILTLGGVQELLTVNEYGLYSLVLGSRKPEAKQFKRWITHEVLPSIRKHGGYIAPDATKEQVKALHDYHPSNLYDTFLNATVNTNHLNQMIAECMKFYKSAPYEKPAKQNALYKKQMFKAIRKALNKLRIENGKNNNFGEVLTLDNVLLSLADKEQKIVRNSSKSKIKYRDNKIGKLEMSQEKLLEVINKLKPPSLDEYFVIDKHPFSENYIVDTDLINGKPQLIKRDVYKKWEREFPTWQLPDKEDIDIDWDRPMISYIRYIHQDNFDMSNFDKSFHDFIFRYYGENDRVIKHNDHATLFHCINKADGKIYWLLKNIEEEIE